MTNSSVRDNAIVAAACGLGMFCMARAWSGLRGSKALIKQMQELQVRKPGVEAACLVGGTVL